MASKKSQTKFIFVTGGVLSGLGKGITAASIGNLLKARGLKVNIMKCDMYLNVDAGTLNPAEHGEVFVTADGAETDLDLGHYERFLDQELTGTSSLMSGQILSRIILDERQGKYLGKTVQIIPHVTQEIQKRILQAGEGFDVHIVEIGGTVGDYEGQAFLEAIRELKPILGEENTLYTHVVYLPYLKASKEVKTKPAQNAVRDLRALGIVPDVLVARTDHEVDDAIIEKLSLFCGVEEEAISIVPTADSVYEIPLLLKDEGIDTVIANKLGVNGRKQQTKNWEKLVKNIETNCDTKAKVGVIAKYMSHEDTYMSVFEALKAAAWDQCVDLDIVWVDAEELEDDISTLKGLDGILVPGGFGSRGVEGKIKAAEYSIKHDIPYLGLCLGMQVGVIALARMHIDKTANSQEFDPESSHKVIHLMEEQYRVKNKGGTMRLGNYECILTKDTKARKLYGKKSILERHRHRYEFNNDYREELAKHGLVIAGQSPDKQLVELIELKDHPFFMASQYHPEFKSRPTDPHPMFTGFMQQIYKNAKKG